MRLIDTDALLDDVMERYCKDCDKRKGIKNGKWRIIYEIGEVPCRACSVDDMKCEIENAPTAIDLVHCKDCVFYEENYMGRMICIDSGNCRNDDDYCSRGARKEE